MPVLPADWRGIGNGGAEEDRTPDLRIANATLSQLSYGPTSDRILLAEMPRCHPIKGRSNYLQRWLSHGDTANLARPKGRSLHICTRRFLSSAPRSFLLFAERSWTHCKSTSAIGAIRAVFTAMSMRDQSAQKPCPMRRWSLCSMCCVPPRSRPWISPAARRRCTLDSVN